MGHVALYCRISQDKAGRAEGVELQAKMGSEYAALTWPGVPVVVYPDNDISAFNGAHRPEYERLREAIRAGAVARLWVVEQSRLQRDERRWFEFAAELELAGITEVHSQREGIIRPGDVVAGLKAVLSAHEVRQMKRRLNDKLDDNAAKGIAPGSRPFGYEHAVTPEGDKTYVIVPEQAKAIERAAEKVLAGWSLENIARELRAQGMTGAHGGKIRPGAVRSMVTNPTVAGFRVHRGEVTGRGNWEPILDEATWQACRSRLSGARTVQRSAGGTYPITAAHTGYSGRRYVLTGGLAVCGVCGAPLIGTVKQLKGGRKESMPYLLCHPNAGGKACVGIMLEATEKHVISELFAELDKPEFLALVAADDHAQRRDEITAALSGIDGQRAELAALWGSPGGLTSAEWQAARSALADQERALRTELAAHQPVPARVDIERAKSSWPSMTLDEKRAFVRLFIDVITISRARPGLKYFDDSRVSISWRRAT
jgi:DNA invertase Pin-like site-specific DNA recombinase